MPAPATPETPAPVHWQSYSQLHRGHNGRRRTLDPAHSHRSATATSAPCHQTATGRTIQQTNETPLLHRATYDHMIKHQHEDYSHDFDALLRHVPISIVRYCHKVRAQRLPWATSTTFWGDEGKCNYTATIESRSRVITPISRLKRRRSS